MIRLLAFPGTTVPGLLDYLVTLVLNTCVMLLGTWVIWKLSTKFGTGLTLAKLIANAITLIVNFAFRNFLDRSWRCFLTYQKKH